MSQFDIHWTKLTGHYAALYDWCQPYGKRTREEYRYSYDDHYVWREFDKHDIPKCVDVIYSDRMREWDAGSYELARKESKAGWMEDLTKEQAKRFIEIFYAGAYECVGFARSCNHSTGYGIGIFFIKEKGN